MNKKPILMKGERLIVPIIKKTGFSNKKLPNTYEEIKKKLQTSLNLIKDIVSKRSDEFLPNEIIVCARMEEGFLAKSYRPDFLQKDNNMSLVGARKIKSKTKILNKNQVNKESKIYFFRTSIEGINNFQDILANNLLSKTATEGLRMLNNIELLNNNEKLFGFDKSDTNLEVEIVLHPLNKNYELAINKIKSIVGDNCEIRNYIDGPTFILANINKDTLPNLVKYNFLRTVHPMRNINIPNITRSTSMDLPRLNTNDKVNTNIIKIGVFDGGVSLENSLIKDFVIKHNLSGLHATENGINHGTAVCGAILYGNLNTYSSNDLLDHPKVIVESFRVLPEVNLYKVIDNIENIVNKKTDIKIYNISFGPTGPIWDDEINRFTYALDYLSYKNEVLFCIAVGNDGELEEPFNRIQVPSDSVNGLGIGAYSEYDGKKYRAKYSCVGPGREGAKIKPDLLAFGGDVRNPFHAIGAKNGIRNYICGTSFAAPIVAGKLGELLSVSNEISILMSKAILVHNASNNCLDANKEGYGIVSNCIDDLINCSDKKITILYTGEITEKKYLKLPIPLPNKVRNIKGSIKINWTITALTDVNALDPDGYTSSCIEDTFYPNSSKYRFTKAKNNPLTLDIEQSYKEANELVSNGYKQSTLPISDSPTYLTEEERRQNLQWDTIVRKSKTKRFSSLDKPFIVIHCIPREDKNAQKLKFCVIITLESTNYNGDLYNDIISEYPVLVPLKATIDTEIDVETKIDA